MLKSGHRWSRAERKEKSSCWTVPDVKHIRLEPHKWFFLEPFVKFADRYFDFEFKSSDILIMTFPKCGTTWTQEMVWTMLNNPDSNENNGSSSLPIDLRSPFIELDFVMDETVQGSSASEMEKVILKMQPNVRIENDVYLKFAEFFPSPRILKTHLPFELLSPQLLDRCKVIYVARNPKDAALSFYHHYRLLKCMRYKGDLDDFIDRFTNDEVLFSPYWEHLKQAWIKRNHPNLHFCFFEDMKADPRREISRISDFLDAKLSDTQIDNVVHGTSFREMKKKNVINLDESKKSSVNVDYMKEKGGFFRKGIVDDWKNSMTSEQAAKIDDWSKQNVAEFGQEFKYFKT